MSAGINPDRVLLARKRIRNVLRTHVVATLRTLEQKISDAGPFNQRVDPHVLTQARKSLEIEKVLVTIQPKNIPWHHLADADANEVASRLAEQQAVHNLTLKKDFTVRAGQAAEIAVYKALLEQTEFDFFGSFPDLQEHDDSTLYSKEEPPSTVSGRRIPGKKKLDFLLLHPSAGAVGVEIKNIREWLYPDREEVRDVLGKCVGINAVPVLIARRIPYATFSVLNRCGVIVHQLYGQIYPAADEELANLVRNKRLLGYHDIRVGNEPDDRLKRFIGVNLPSVVDASRTRFEQWKQEIEEYASGTIQYREFIAKLRGSYVGQEEAREEEPEPDWSDFPPDEDGL